MSSMNYCSHGLGTISWFLIMAFLVVNAAGQCPVFQVSPPILMTAASQALNDYPDGTSLTFECQAGYFRSGGSPKIRCSNSVWSPLTLMCDKKNCGSPGEILNGGFDLSEGTLFGAKATGHCDEGYQIVGRKVRLCLADGWSGEVPRCEVVKCEEPPSISNGTHSPQQPIFHYGMKVRYTCNRGFDMVGNDKGESVCSADGTFKPAPPQCKVIECPNPTLEFGYKVTGRVSPYRKNHQITFKCNDGYTMNGSSTVTCGENGWSPAIPTCFKAEVVNNGQQEVKPAQPECNTGTETEDISTAIIHKKQYQVLILEERKLKLEIEKLEIEKKKLLLEIQSMQQQ
ncbi:complement component receptor 1-like protein isoform X2 [Amia ocellicauda]|uniref:complement component receptor 1-like protein isoform X2 n=1 Tax=Amia ocellicauda TaxID=2972642 RepID=UPI0034645024